MPDLQGCSQQAFLVWWRCGVEMNQIEFTVIVHILLVCWRHAWGPCSRVSQLLRDLTRPLQGCLQRKHLASFSTQDKILSSEKDVKLVPWKDPCCAPSSGWLPSGSRAGRRCFRWKQDRGERWFRNLEFNEFIGFQEKRNWEGKTTKEAIAFGLEAIAVGNRISEFCSWCLFLSTLLRTLEFRDARIRQLDMSDGKSSFHLCSSRWLQRHVM